MTGIPAWIAFVSDRLPELCLRTGEHVVLTAASTGIAIVLGIPLGVCAARVWWLRGALTGFVGILQTIPSLAMLAFLLALLGKIGALPATIALTLYALLPIVRNTITGLEGLSPDVVEAARGLGMTPWQQLRLVGLPLAMPVIVAGIRTAAVVCVGIATLSAFIGAGGLGQFINRGLALSSTPLILLGAIPSALLALLVDGTIAASQWGLGARPSRSTPLRAALTRLLRPLALASPALLVAAGLLVYFVPANGSRTPEGNDEPAVIRIGSKNFTEQLILGELMAQLIEGRTGLSVQRRFNLGGTMICHEALSNGEIDLYAEYTGTALTAVLKQPASKDRGNVFQTVSREYDRQFGLKWLDPFGFNNTYAITVRRQTATTRGLQRISDLTPVAGSLRAGFTAEFSERPDGYPGLQRVYGLAFHEVRDLDPSLMYSAMANREVDVICAFATDGRIPAYDLVPLQDDRGFFPPYEAAPVIRADTLRAHPTLRAILNGLAGRLSDEAMQRLNFAVDDGGQSPADVAQEFLLDSGLLLETRTHSRKAPPASGHSSQ